MPEVSVRASIPSLAQTGKPLRVRHACKGMDPGQRAAYFGPTGYGRKLFGDREADNQLREIERKRQGGGGRPTSISEYCRQRGLNSPRDWLKFCTSGDALKVFPADVVEAEEARLTKVRSRIRNVVVSASWYTAAWRDQGEYPPGGGDDTGMVLSEARTRWGEHGTPSRRWTPAIAVKVEDELDLCPQPRRGEPPLVMRIADAYGSPSARAIIVLRERRISPHNKAELRGLADDRGRVGRKKSQQGRKAREEQ